MSEAHSEQVFSPWTASPKVAPPAGGGHGGPPGTGADDDALLLAQVRLGNESAFTALVERHASAMLRFARLYTADTALAEDAVQEAWIGFLRGVNRFEARASLRTWLYRILLNRLRTRLKREGHLIPFSAFFDAAGAPSEPAVDPDRFLGADHPRWPYHWRVPPESFGESPEECLLAKETRLVIEAAVAALPPAQREVITLRDMEGWTAQEVCNVLHISESNQRVLLHRARSKVRQSLAQYLAQG